MVEPARLLPTLGALMVGARTHSPNVARFGRTFFAGLIALSAVTLATFWPVLTFDFVRWDDDINITQNPLLTSPWSWELLGRFFAADHALRFKPLHWLFARVIHDTFGLEPAAWHAANLGLHVVAAALFYVVLGQVITRAFSPPPILRDSLAWAGAALWALHPLRVEPVAWATASTYPFATVWLLASFACWLQGGRRGERGRGWRVAAWGAAVAAYLSYPVSLAYGVFLWIVDRWTRQGGETASESTTAAAPPLRWQWPVALILPAVIAAAFTVWTRYAAPGIFGEAPTMDSVGLLTRAGAALASLSFLGARLFWTAGLTPNVPPMDLSGVARWQIMALAVAAVALLVLAWRGRREHPGRAGVVLGFAVISLPCLGLTERPTWPVDRYSYVAHLVLMGGAGIAVGSRLESVQVRRLAAALTLVVIALAVVGTRRQLEIWRDSGTLFAHMERHPRFARHPRQQGHIYVVWARHEASHGRAARAAELFNRAQQVYLDAIRAAVARGDYAEALAISTHVERHFSLTPVLRRERGAWLLRLARFDEALVELQRARLAAPGDARVEELLRESERRAGRAAP